MVELGSQRLIPEIEAGLIGISAGETKEISYGDGETVEATIKEIKEKELPELDDELARSVSEFDTLAELREDIERRLSDQLDAAVESDFRAAALAALVRESNVAVSPELVRQRATTLRELLQSLERRGIDLDTFLALTNQTAEQVEERIVAQAAGSIAGELVLEARRRPRPPGHRRRDRRDATRAGRGGGHDREGRGLGLRRAAPPGFAPVERRSTRSCPR